jgi:tRNA A-37 threonylcarbamoyl transferase component Bud32
VSDSALPDRYRSAELIARGGMGEVYRAEDSVLGRTVAVKLLAVHLADDEATRGRFTREALAAARLSQAPSTVTIFDVGEHEDRPYIVMEHMSGGSLADRVQRDGAQPVGLVLKWLAQAAAALDAAHTNGIVHRDVKPANLLLDEEENVKVADFGVASAAGLGSYTEAGSVVGTAGYLSPEQARGERATPASDRYALAVVAFELLTGSRPFERESATSEAMAHVQAPIPAASAGNGDLPAEVDDVLARGLAKDPDARFGSAAEFVSELRDALSRAAGTTRIVPAAPPPPPRRRAVPLLPVVLGAVLFAGIGAAALLARDDGDPERTDAASTAPPRTVKVRETITAPGTTVVQTQTVTTAPEPPPEEEEEEAPPTTQQQQAASGDPVELNDQGYALMQQGDYQGALPLLERAVSGLSGSGELAEAYASYNLAYTRRALGRCDGVLELLNRSQQIQGVRTEITRLRGETEQAC